MAEDRKIFKIKEDNLGEVRIADEVVAIIAPDIFLLRVLIIYLH